MRAAEGRRPPLELRPLSHVAVQHLLEGVHVGGVPLDLVQRKVDSVDLLADGRTGGAAAGGWWGGWAACGKRMQLALAGGAAGTWHARAHRAQEVPMQASRPGSFAEAWNAATEELLRPARSRSCIPTPALAGPSQGAAPALPACLLLLRGDLPVQLLPPHQQLLQGLLALCQRGRQHLLRGGCPAGRRVWREPHA